MTIRRRVRAGSPVLADGGGITDPRGLPIPAEVELYLRQLTAGAVEAGEVTDLYEAAGIPRPDLSHLDEAFIERMQQARNPQLAIEALRRLVEQEMRKVTRHNVVRQQSFSDRLVALMTRYTNQNLSAAQVIAELVAMAMEVSADASRGQRFAPALTSVELAFYDAVAQNESAVTEMGHRCPRRYRPRPGQVPAPRRQHRLGLPRRRPCQAPLHHQTPARPLRLPTRRPAHRHRTRSPPNGDLCGRMVT